MAKHVRRWCAVGGLALGCAWLNAVQALPVQSASPAARSAGEAATAWMLRWTVWLQDYLLTCGFLV